MSNKDIIKVINVKPKYSLKPSLYKNHNPYNINEPAKFLLTLEYMSENSSNLSEDVEKDIVNKYLMREYNATLESLKIDSIKSLYPEAFFI